jgi:hypothetical protein
MTTWKHLVAAAAVGFALITAPMADAATATPSKKHTTSHVVKKAPVSTKKTTKSAKGKTPAKHTPVHKSTTKHATKTKHLATKKPTATKSRLAKQGTKGWKHHPTV